MNTEFWKNKKVFITGHTGFKGGWLSLWLSKMGAEVKGYSLLPDKPESFFSSTNLSSILDSQIGDIRDEKKLYESCKNHEVFINLACISNDTSFALDEKLSTSINLDAFEPMVIAAKKSWN